MLKTSAKIIGVFLSMAIIISCSNNFDFVGYVVYHSTDKLTIVEMSDREPPNVLLHVNPDFQVGSKVEVRYIDEVMNTAFPSTARAEIREIDRPVKEKEALMELFTSISNQNGPYYYTAVLNISEQDGGWKVETKEFDYDRDMGIYLVSYEISEDTMHITMKDRKNITSIRPLPLN